MLKCQLNPIQAELQIVKTEGQEHYKNLFLKLEESILTVRPPQLDHESQSHSTQRNFDKVMSRLEDNSPHENVVRAINEHTTNSERKLIDQIQTLLYTSIQEARTTRSVAKSLTNEAFSRSSSQVIEVESESRESLRQM